MFKDVTTMFLYTETSLHCGSGSSLGVVDLPIQREKYTDYPVCQASGVKGAVREWFEAKFGKDDRRVIYAFGPDFSNRKEEEAFAGAASFTDARLLLFPVRSLNSVFAYTTSPFALNRLRRDLQVTSRGEIPWSVPTITDKAVLCVPDSLLAARNGKLILEEYTFDAKPDKNVADLAAWLATNAIPKGEEYDFWRNKVKSDLVVLPDNRFRDFVKLSTEIQARIRINSETKTVDEHALFYEEALPSDALLYSMVLTHDPACDKEKRPDNLKSSTDVMALLTEMDGERLQFGGDATIGRGIVNLRFLKTNGGN